MTARICLALDSRDERIGCGADGARSIELRAQIAPFALQDRSGDRLQQHALGTSEAVGPEEVHPAGTVLPPAPRSVLEDACQLRLDLIQVGDRVFVEDDDVGLEAFQAPVLLCV